MNNVLASPFNIFKNVVVYILYFYSIILAHIQVNVLEIQALLLKQEMFAKHIGLFKELSNW